MDPRPPPFKPKRLDALDVENPMTAGMRRLAPEDASRLHDERLRQARRLAPFGPRARKRTLRCALAAVPCFVLINGFFHVFLGLQLGLREWWIQVPVAALAGAAIGALRPGRGLSGIIVAGAFLIMALAAGAVSIFGLYLTVLYTAVWFCLGMAVGIDQDMCREEGLT